MIKKLIIILIFLSAVNVSAYTISGHVNTTSGSNIESANLTLSSQVEVFSDGNGNYVFKNVSSGSYQIFVDALGYRNIESTVNVSNDTILNFTLMTWREGTISANEKVPGFESYALVVALVFVFVFLMHRKV